VIEVLPVFDQGCPCSMYKALFAAEPSTLDSYQLQSRDKRFSASAVSRADRNTYNADVSVPWGRLAAVLTAVSHRRGAPIKLDWRSVSPCIVRRGQGTCYRYVAY
jgi:uncharacterized protein (DUF3084 family)